jgi:hypothetical protein
MSRPCIIKTDVEDGVWPDSDKPRRKFTSWCGNSQNVPVGMEAYPYGQRCPKCSARFYASITEPGWTLEKIDTGDFSYRSEENPYCLPASWKSIYLAKKDGERAGMIMIDNGWGQQWEVRKLAPRMSGDGNVKISVRGNVEYLSHHFDRLGKRTPETPWLSDGQIHPPPKFDAKRFNSKEQALFYLSQSLADGLVMAEKQLAEESRRLVTAQAERLAQKAIDDAERITRREQMARDREAQAKRDADELDLIAIAFAELVTGDTLTNFQRDALLTAARRLGIEGLE